MRRNVRYKVDMGTCPYCLAEMESLGWKISPDGLKTWFFYKCPDCGTMTRHTHPPSKR